MPPIELRQVAVTRRAVAWRVPGTTRRDMSAITEPFGAVPTRLADDLHAGHLTMLEFAVLVWLELRLNYRVSPPIWRGTTSGMAEAMAWQQTPKHLGRLLRSLHAKGYIVSTAKPRSPKPYTVHLTRGAALREGDTAEWASDAPASPGAGKPSTDWRTKWASDAPVTGTHAPVCDPETPGEARDCADAGLAPCASPQKQRSVSHEVMAIAHGHCSSRQVGLESLEGFEGEALSGTQQEPGVAASEAFASEQLRSLLEESFDDTGPLEKGGPIPTMQELRNMRRDDLYRLEDAHPELAPKIRSAVAFRGMCGLDDVEVASSPEPDPYGTLARFDNGPTSAQMDTEAWQVRHGRRPG